MMYTTNEVLKLMHGLVRDALCRHEGEREIENAIMQMEFDTVEYLLEEEEKSEE